MTLPTRNLPTRFAGLTLVVALTLGACGGSGDGELSAAVRARLDTLVTEVRRAADSGDTQRSRRALAQLKSTVSSYEEKGAISTARAATILAAAAGVESRLALIPTTTTTTTTTTAPPDNGRGKDGDGDDKKGGKGNDGKD